MRFLRVSVFVNSTARSVGLHLRLFRLYQAIFVGFAERGRRWGRCWYGPRNWQLGVGRFTVGCRSHF